MLGTAEVMTFVATTNAAAAREFYEETLGLRFVEDSPHALVLDLNGTMLRVQKVQAFTPHHFTALGWQVDEIAATVRALADRGVEFLHVGVPGQDELGVWDSGAGKVAWFKDPDGNTLSLTQFA